MALFDSILESNFNGYITEGYLTTPKLKSSLLSVILKIYNGKIDMSNGKQLLQALKKCKEIDQANILYTLSSAMKDTGEPVYQHRYIIFTPSTSHSSSAMYLLDIWNRTDKLFAQISLNLICDYDLCYIPEKYVTDFVISAFDKLLAKKICRTCKSRKKYYGNLSMQ